jgi:hypothetical protein
VPDIKSKHMDESRVFYVDFLGLKVGMDMGFITTFVSPSNPTSQISVMRDDGSILALIQGQELEVLSTSLSTPSRLSGVCKDISSTHVRFPKEVGI